MSHDTHEQIMDGRRALALGLLGAAGLMAAKSAQAASNKKLVMLFQRFAADGLMELVPAGDPDFTRVRPADCWPASLLDIGDPYWKLHGALGGVRTQLWDTGQLALIPATHIPEDTRSHFTSQALMETAGGSGTDVGFCSRALNISRAAPELEPILRGVCISPYVPDLARGDYQFLSIPDPAGYRLTSKRANIHEPILQVYGPDAPGVLAVAAKTATAINQVRTNVANQSVTMPDTHLGAMLRRAAQFIKASVGTQVLTVDYGGWDHHTNVQSQMQTQMQIVNDALVSFKAALGGDTPGSHWQDTTVVLMTEFGRTLKSNTGTNGSQGGTDHGWGSLMMVTGGSVQGGIYGNWQGLASGESINAVLGLNDYRHALAEVIATGLGIPQLNYVLPDFTPSFHGLYA